MMISFSDRRLPISLLVSKALLIVKALSDITFGIKSAFDSKSAFRYHFWMQKCKIGAFGYTSRVEATCADTYVIGRKQTWQGGYEKNAFFSERKVTGNERNSPGNERKVPATVFH